MTSIYYDLGFLFSEGKNQPSTEGLYPTFVAGVIYITINKVFSLEFENMKGVLFLLASVLCFAIYSVMARKLTQDFSSMELSYIMIIVSFIAFNIISLTGHAFKGSLGSFVGPLKNMTFLISVLYLGILSSSGTSFLSKYALSKMESSKMSLFSQSSNCNIHSSWSSFLKGRDLLLPYYRLHLYNIRSNWYQYPGKKG